MMVKCACGCRESTPDSEVSDWLPIYQIGLEGNFKVLYFWSSECLFKWGKAEAEKDIAKLMDDRKNSLINFKLG